MVNFLRNPKLQYKYMKKLDYLQTAHNFLYINWVRTGLYASGEWIISIAIFSGDIDPAYAKQHIRN